MNPAKLQQQAKLIVQLLLNLSVKDRRAELLRLNVENTALHAAVKTELNNIKERM